MNFTMQAFLNSYFGLHAGDLGSNLGGVRTFWLCILDVIALFLINTKLSDLIDGNK